MHTLYDQDKNRQASVPRFYGNVTRLFFLLLVLCPFPCFFYIRSEKLDFLTVEIFIRAVILRAKGERVKFVFAVGRRQKENSRSSVVCIRCRSRERSDRFSARSRNLLRRSTVTGLTLRGLRPLRIILFSLIAGTQTALRSVHRIL